MNATEFGSKHVCEACATKFYDLKRANAVCPKCGSKPIAPKAPRAARTVGKTKR
ncbi:MAG: hypothetical protein HOM58_18825 [Rhodospirillaceae bacterium]|jgi:uncharacterized protein (TIGR02300 family)|nr:hypothetical protein [Rhodospirillaceae bacterium]